MELSRAQILLEECEQKLKDAKLDRFNMTCELSRRMKTPPKKTKNTFTWNGVTQNKGVYNTKQWNKKNAWMRNEISRMNTRISNLEAKKLDIIYSDEELTIKYLELDFE